MALDPAEEGEILSTTLDDSGEVRCKVDASGGEEIPDVRLRMPLGTRARPEDGDNDGGADCLFQRNGDEAEVLISVDRGVVDKLHQMLGELPKGSFQVHSLGTSPQSVTLKDGRIQIGNSTDGEKSAARVDDHVDCGKLNLVVVGPKLEVFYLAPGGVPPGVKVLGLTLAAMGDVIDFPAANFTVNLEGKIDKGSKLVKIAGLSE